MKRIGHNHLILIIIVALISVSIAISIVRLSSLDYDLNFIVPERVYTLEIEQSFTGHGSPVDLLTYLPVTNERQRVIEEDTSSGNMVFDAGLENGNATCI